VATLKGHIKKKKKTKANPYSAKAGWEMEKLARDDPDLRAILDLVGTDSHPVADIEDSMLEEGRHNRSDPNFIFSIPGEEDNDNIVDVENACVFGGDFSSEEEEERSSNNFEQNNQDNLYVSAEFAERIPLLEELEDCESGGKTYWQ